VVSAEKAVLRIIAAESAIFVTLDIVLSPSFVRRLRCDGTPDKIERRPRYSGRRKVGASLLITFSSPVSEAYRRNRHARIASTQQLGSFATLAAIRRASSLAGQLVRRARLQLNSVCPRVRAMKNLADWTHITTGFEGRAVNGSFAVEEGTVIVKSSRGDERRSQIEVGVNPIWTAVRLLRDLAAAGKA